MIELYDRDKRDNNRQSSKGNQLKWEKDEIWYKADYAGYEGLAECVVSYLLTKSSLKETEYVTYEPELIKHKGSIFNGCKSRTFADNLQEVTLERLFKTLCGKSLNSMIYSVEDHRERFVNLVNRIEELTEVSGWGIYINKMVTIDALFLNEDRHTHNIALLWDGKERYKTCPFYDHGAALLSDTTLDYPIGCDIYEEMTKVKSKTICTSFEEQLDISEELYGRNIEFYWTEKDVDCILGKLDMYSKEIRERVKELLMQQRRKYKYLFKE